MLNFKIYPKFSLYITLTFILFTVIGTLSHELGHIVVAKYLGYNTKLFYGSMTYNYKGIENDADVNELQSLYKEYEEEIINEQSFKAEKRFEALKVAIDAKYPTNLKHDFWVILGGPIQTLVTSFLGLLILYLRRYRETFKLIDWLAVFLGLFALREVFNFVMALFYSFIYGRNNFHGDEFKLSRYLELNEWIIPILTMLLGCVISYYIMFRVIPIKYRFSFILSGFLGGVLGFAIWFGGFGEFIFS